ncbi:hypothetical protein D3C72_1608020 [compost metagenome]
MAQGMVAEGVGARRLGAVQPEARLEPDPVGVDQRHDGDGHVEVTRHQARDPIEALFRRRVEDPERM